VSEAVKEKTVDEVMEIIGVGKFQYFVFLICGISFMADAVEVSLLSFLAECLEVEWALSDVQKSALTSIVFVGQLFGSYFWGPFADKKVIVRGVFVGVCSVCVCVCVVCV
jgi:MFS family permease